MLGVFFFLSQFSPIEIIVINKTILYPLEYPPVIIPSRKKTEQDHVLFEN